MNCTHLWTGAHGIQDEITAQGRQWEQKLEKAIEARKTSIHAVRQRFSEMFAEFRAMHRAETTSSFDKIEARDIPPQMGRYGSL